MVCLKYCPELGIRSNSATGKNVSGTQSTAFDSELSVQDHRLFLTIP